MPIFAILFFVVPLVEIYLLIEVGQWIGALPTIALCVLTAVIGGALLRQQGLQTLTRARTQMDRGEIPAQELLEGLVLAIGGALLVTPGLATDAVGFACLLPPSRLWLVRQLLQRVELHAHVSGGGGGAAPEQRRRGETIEGEYRRSDERDE